MAHESTLSIRFTHGDLRLLSETPLPAGFDFDSIIVSRTIARFFNYFALANIVRDYFGFDQFASIDGVELDSAFIAQLREMLNYDWETPDLYWSDELIRFANELRSEDRRGNADQLRRALDEIEPWVATHDVTVVFESQGS
jgi:hypothetical protein